MNKNLAAKVKKNIKHYTPEIMSGAIIAAGVVYIIVLARTTEQPVDGLVFGASKVALDMIKEGGALLYETEEGNFLLTHTTI